MVTVSARSPSSMTDHDRCRRYTGLVEGAMDTLEVEAAGGVATVRLNRPPVNAVNKTMMRELRRAFDALSQDRSVGAVVLAGRGDRAFCGGIDLHETVDAGPDDGGDLRGLLDPFWEWRQAQYAIHQCLVPVIA